MKTNTRLPVIDYLRGFFVVWMMIFHFCFLLADYGLVDFDFYRDPFWLHSRSIIVSGFLTIVGISLVLANRGGFKAKPYTRRLALLIAYASVVSVSTYIQAGERWVYFGILHFIAAATVMALPFIKHPKLSIVTGVAIVAVGLGYQNPLFDPKWLNWIGMMTHKPQTNDYVPIVPWLGVVLIGIFVGHFITSPQSKALQNTVFSWQSTNSVLSIVDFLGRHAIHVYIIHVPVFVALIELWLILMK